MLIGAHTRKNETPDKTRQMVKTLGWSALQTHWGSPRTLKLPDTVAGMDQSTYKHGEDPVWVFHSAYVAHSTPPQSSRAAAGAYLKKLFKHAATVGSAYVVLHTGGTKEKAREAIIEDMQDFFATYKINEYLQELSKGAGYPIKLAIENVAAKYPWNQDLFNIANTVKPYSHIGWCLDLAHSWAAGCDLQHTLDVVNTEPPLICHSNFPGSKFGSGLDRHGWRYQPHNTPANPEQLEIDAWDEVIRSLAKQNVILIVEGSGSIEGDMITEVEMLKKIAQHETVEHLLNEDHRSKGGVELLGG